MDRDHIERWLTSYRRAWRSDNPADIKALFTEEATYSPYPFAGAWHGVDQIVEGWIGHHDSEKIWTFEHEILAIDGDTAIIHGETHYDASPEEPESDFSNIWLVRFAEDGRAREFREWWVERSR
jgi:ketosteroid isomerase-like protein